MNNETKRILGKFIFCCVIICCLFTLAAGTVTAKQKGDYNMFYKQYAVFSMKTNNKKIEMSVNEKTLTFDYEKFKIPEKYTKYIYYTPLSSVAFFISNLKEMLQ